MRLRGWSARTALALAATLVGSLGAAAPSMAVETVYGLTDGDDLVTFSSDRPGDPSTPLDVTGLVAGDNLVGIDFRPATNQLFAIAKVGATSNGRLYAIDVVTGQATARGGVLSGVVGGSQQGFDFNPFADRIRLVNDGPNESFRLNPNDGTLAATDASLAYAAGDPNAGADPSIEGVAYTNSIGGSRATRLFGIDTGLDTLTQFGPGNADPNNGQMTTSGPLGVNVSEVAGFDIAPGGEALAALRPTGQTHPRLYAIDTSGPATGALREVGQIGATGPPAGPVVDAIAIAPRVRTFAALTDETAQRLFTFRADRPSVTTAPVAITGMPAGVRLVGIDTRQATGALYGVGSDSRLYTLDLDTGAATVAGASPFAPALNGSAFGVDFNPVPDQLRVVSDNEQNLRIHPGTGAGAGSANAADTPLANAANPTPNVVGSAYTNPVAGAASTTLYGIDSGSAGQPDPLVLQDPPNGGVLTNIGPLNLDSTSTLGYDIVPEGNQGFAALNPVATPAVSNLYSVNPGGTAPGTAILVGRIGGADAPPVSGIAFLNEDVITVASTPIVAGEDAGSVVVSLVRSGPADSTATVAVSTLNITAASGADFAAPTPATVTFGRGERLKRVSVPILDDSALEGNELFAVLIESPTGGASIGKPSATIVAIVDNERAPSDPEPYTVPPGDTDAPVVTIGVAERLRVRELRRGIRVRVGVSEAALIYGDLRLRGQTLARFNGRRTSAGVVTARLRLSRAARRSLARRRSSVLTLVVAAFDAAGNPGLARDRIRVTRR